MLVCHIFQRIFIQRWPRQRKAQANVICISKDTTLLLGRLGGTKAAVAKIEREYFKDFAAQPPEQKGGTVSTVANSLRP